MNCGQTTYAKYRCPLCVYFTLECNDKSLQSKNIVSKVYEKQLYKTVFLRDFHSKRS